MKNITHKCTLCSKKCFKSVAYYPARIFDYKGRQKLGVECNWAKWQQLSKIERILYEDDTE